MVPLLLTSLFLSQTNSLVPCVGNGPDWLKKIACDYISSTGYPGVWISVTSRGKSIGSVAAGFANKENAQVARIDDRVRIGSISKSVVGTVAAYFVKKGVIRYEDKLYDIVPECQSGMNSYSNVTLEMLLTHQSGLDGKESTIKKVPTVSEFSLIRRANVILSLKVPPMIDSGMKTHYSGAGIDAAVLMLETKTGKTWENILATVVAHDWKLASIGMGTPDSHGTTGYSAGIAGSKQNFAYEYGSAGSIHITIDDLCKFGLLQCFDYSVTFSATDLKIMHENVADRFTRASLLRTESGMLGYMVRHAGAMTRHTGHTSTLWIAPKYGVVVAVSTNAGELNGPVLEKLGTQITDPVFWRVCKSVTGAKQ